MGGCVLERLKHCILSICASVVCHSVALVVVASNTDLEPKAASKIDFCAIISTASYLVSASLPDRVFQMEYSQHRVCRPKTPYSAAATALAISCLLAFSS